VPFDPCGQVMDVGRFCYSTEAQFFRDDPRTATIRWYRAADDAEFFPTAHKWGQLSWYTEPWAATGVGEVYGAKRVWSNGFTPPTATGQGHFGALEDFQLGAAFDASSSTPRDPWGLADACGGGDPGLLLQEPAYKPLILQEDGSWILIE
jgi:hypothetical protein